MIQAIVFDFDGTIFDTEGALFDVWADLYREHGLELPLEQWALNVGGEEYAIFNPLTHLIEHAGLSPDHPNLHDTRREERYRERLSRLGAMPGIVESIEWARAQGLKLAVASNSERGWVYGYLDQLGLRKHFAAIACGDEAEAQKPHPALYRLAIRRLRVPAKHALAIEDSQRGVESAKAAGLLCAAVPNKLTRGLDLSAADWRLEEGVSAAALAAILEEAAARDAV